MKLLKNKFFLVIIAAAVVAAGGLKSDSACGAGFFTYPLAFLGSITGCGGDKQPEQKPASAADIPDNSLNAETDKQADKSAKKEIIVTFVELGSVNCIPCKMMQPVMKEIEQKYGSQVKVVFHDVWTPQGKPYGQSFGIRAIPTQIFFR